MAIATDILISPQAMQQVDENAAQSGIISTDLMERAGSAVAAVVLRDFPQALRFVVLCGPGNNGGDGYVAARYLKDAGAEILVYSSCDIADLKGDAKWAKDQWLGAIHPLYDYVPHHGDVVVDALFGAGLTRVLSEAVGSVAANITQLDLPVISVDLPSGINGQSGALLGAAFRAIKTISFAALKPAHMLQPAASFCGDIELVDIGIPQRILRSVAPAAFINQPSLWQEYMPRLGAQSHKYRRGHLTVFSGGAQSSGAARLCASAALHSGAGIITLAAPDGASANVLAQHLTAMMQVKLDSLTALETWLSDPRHETFVIGPGFGDLTRLTSVLSRLVEKRVVLDADALSAIARKPSHCFEQFATAGHRIMTPHEGEFNRLFGEIAADQSLSKVDKAKRAAKLSHSVVIYKGADSVIAAPDGRVAVNGNAPPSLATAGSGDVLAGICGALLANGVAAFEAACAAVWLHGDAAKRGPFNLNAEQLASLVQPYRP